MGSRANYIITENGRHEIFYSHWGAQKVPRDFFFGLETALSVIRSTEPTNDLLDDVWSEGGAILDIDRKRLRLWGGEDVQHNPSLRELWLQLLAISWPDWSLFWANHGMFELADHIGVSRQTVRKRGIAPKELRRSDSLEPSGRYCLDTFLTVRRQDETLHDVVLGSDPERLIERGPTLLNISNARVSSPVPVESADTGWPFQCIYFDIPAKTMWISSRSTFDPDDHEAIEQVWPHWSTHFHTLGLQRHLALTGRNPTPFQLPAERHIPAVANFIKSGDLDPERIINVLEKLDAPSTEKVILNPRFRQKHGLKTPSKERMDHFLKVLAVWRAERQKDDAARR